MDKKLDEQLVKDFPLLYSDRHGSMYSTCLYWGLSVGNGWEPIIRELSEKLEPMIQKIIDENPVTCRCGIEREYHLNDGQCTYIYHLPVWGSWKWLSRWGHFSCCSSVYDSKKLKDRLNVFWMKVKSKIAWRINKLVSGLAWWLCDKGIWYKKELSNCKQYKMEHPRASQVKEKFGGLRFYMTDYIEEMDKAIQEAEKASYKTCEACGKPGKTYNDGWMQTLCEEHAKADGREDWDDDEEI